MPAVIKSQQKWRPRRRAHAPPPLHRAATLSPASPPAGTPKLPARCLHCNLFAPAATFLAAHYYYIHSRAFNKCLSARKRAESKWRGQRRTGCGARVLFAFLARSARGNACPAPSPRAPAAARQSHAWLIIIGFHLIIFRVRGPFREIACLPRPPAAVRPYRQQTPATTAEPTDRRHRHHRRNLSQWLTNWCANRMRTAAAAAVKSYKRAIITPVNTIIIIFHTLRVKTRFTISIRNKKKKEKESTFDTFIHLSKILLS